MPASMFTASRLVITGNRFVSTGMGAVYEGILELDSSATPRRLNMKFDLGPEKGNTNLGIYELDGDTWRICLATHGSIRPSTFDSSSGDGFAFEIFSRFSAGPTTKG